MRKAAADLEFETAARLRHELCRLKVLDREFANDRMTAPGAAVDKAEPGIQRKAAQEAFPKGRL